MYTMLCIQTPGTLLANTVQGNTEAHAITWATIGMVFVALLRLQFHNMPFGFA